jgi:hypothetical protein
VCGYSRCPLKNISAADTVCATPGCGGVGHQACFKRLQNSSTSATVLSATFLCFLCYKKFSEKGGREAKEQPPAEPETEQETEPQPPAEPETEQETEPQPPAEPETEQETEPQTVPEVETSNEQLRPPGGADPAPPAPVVYPPSAAPSPNIAAPGTSVVGTKWGASDVGPKGVDLNGTHYRIGITWNKGDYAGRIGDEFTVPFHKQKTFVSICVLESVSAHPVAYAVGVSTSSADRQSDQIQKINIFRYEDVISFTRPTKRAFEKSVFKEYGDDLLNKPEGVRCEHAPEFSLQRGRRKRVLEQRQTEAKVEEVSEEDPEEEESDAVVDLTLQETGTVKKKTKKKPPGGTGTSHTHTHTHTCTHTHTHTHT